LNNLLSSQTLWALSHEFRLTEADTHVYLPTL